MYQQASLADAVYPMLRRSVTPLALLLPCVLVRLICHICNSQRDLCLSPSSRPKAKAAPALQAAHGARAALMEGCRRGHAGEAEQFSGGYDGPGPCGVSPPHRAHTGGQSCLHANTAARVHDTPSTHAASGYADSGSSGGGRTNSSNSSISHAQMSAGASGATNHPRLSITMTMPWCRGDTAGRGPPFPVIVFINGFQVGS